jgi:hypothetical protein
MEIGATVDPGGFLEIQNGGTTNGTQIYTQNSAAPPGQTPTGDVVDFGGQSIDDIIHPGGVELLGAFDPYTGVTTPGGLLTMRAFCLVVSCWS